MLDNPDIEILSINYNEDPPCGSNITVNLISDINDIQPAPQSNVNYGWNFSWDNGLDPDSWEQNPSITITQPTNDTILTLWAFSEYLIDGNLKRCSTEIDSIIKTYPAIDVSLVGSPLEECEPFEFNLDGNYSQIGSSNVLDPLDAWQYIITNINNDTIYEYGEPDGIQFKII